jgi:hypothetical protein
MVLRRELQRYGLTEGGMYRRNYAAGCSFTNLKGCLTLTLRCDDTSEINIAQLKSDNAKMSTRGKKKVLRPS